MTKSSLTTIIPGVVFLFYRTVTNVFVAIQCDLREGNHWKNVERNVQEAMRPAEGIGEY